MRGFITFLLGAWSGSIITTVVYACLVVAKESDHDGE